MQIRSDGLGLFFSLTTPLSFTIAGAMKRRRGRVECKRQRNEPQTAVKTKRRPEARRPIHWQKRRPETHLVAAENEFQDTKKAAVDEISGRTRSRKRLERQK